MKKIAIILTALISTLANAQQHYPIKNFLQAVVHPWDLVAGIGEGDQQFKTDQKQNSLVQIVNGVRIYNDVYASKSADNLTYRLSPEGRGFRTDDAIVSLKAKRPFNVLYCYQGMPTNFQNEWNAATTKSTVYRRYGSDINSSASYKDISHDLAVLAGRGGQNENVPDYPMFVSAYWWETPQVMYKGAGFYNIIEGGNEWDNRYSNDQPLNGTQYAISWSSMYDSVKKVDPSMRVSTTGLCDALPKTLTDAWAWVNANRGGKFPADFIQVHSYPWGWSLGVSGGLPGELSIIPEVKAMINAANGVPVILGEWSYDIQRDSPMNAPAFSTYTAEQARGLLAVRCLIKFSQIGLHSAYWYRIDQDYFTGDPLGGNFANDNNGTQFATSALRRQTDDAGHFVRTTVGDEFKQMSVFGDYYYSQSDRDDTVQVHRLTNGSRILFAAWRVEKIGVWTDFRGVSHPDYVEIKYNYNFPAGTLYRLNSDSSGVLLQDHFPGGPLELTSSPVFLSPDPVLSPLPVHLISFTADKFTRSVVLKWIVQDAAKVEVEKSEDGFTWTNLGEGILNKVVDMQPAPGKNLYRLKMYEADGSFTYSPLKMIVFGNGSFKVHVVDQLGRTILRTEAFSLEQVKQTLRANGRILPGFYLLQATGTTYTEKFLKQ